jgi:carbamoylphosphate synthase large subunit
MKIALGKSVFVNTWQKQINMLDKFVHLVDIQNTNLNKFLVENNVEYLLALNFADNHYLENYIFDSTLKTSILFTKKMHIDMFDNKLTGIKYFIDNFSECIPKTYILSFSKTNKLIYDSNFVYPIIIKPKFGVSGSNVRICKNKNEYNKNIINYCDMYAVQEYIEYDYEYSGYFVCENGKILGSIIYSGCVGKGLYIKNRIFESPNRDNIDLSKFEKLFMNLGYSGFATVDFKIVNNNLYVFEINPRMGGSIVEHSQMMLLLNQV